MSADPRRFPISLPAGGGGGAVDSVNGQTGAVVLDHEDVGATRLTVDGDYATTYDIDTTPVTPSDLGLVAAVAARIYATAATNCWDDVPVTVALGGTSFTDAAFDLTTANAITVNNAGLYLVTCEVGLFSASGGEGPRTCLIQVNGDTAREFGAPGAGMVRWAASAALVLQAGDAVTLGVFANSGADDVVTMFGSPKDTGLTVIRLGL